MLAVLGKRRTDLTESDVTTMRRVVDRVRAERGETRADGRQAGWRRRLMRIGHDPLKPWAGPAVRPPSRGTISGSACCRRT